MSFCIQEQVAANAVVLEDIEECRVFDTDGKSNHYLLAMNSLFDFRLTGQAKRNLIDLLRSRQDALENKALHAGCILAHTKPPVLKEVVNHLLDRYIERCQVDNSYSHRQVRYMNFDPHNQMPMHVSTGYHHQLIESIDNLNNDLRTHRLDMADLQKSNQYLQDKYRCMKDHYERTIKARDREHEHALAAAAAEAQVDALQDERAALQIENESLKSQLTEVLGKWSHMSQQADRVAKLMLELEASRCRVAQLTNTALLATGAVTPANTLSASGDDEDTASTVVSFKEEECEVKEEIKHEDAVTTVVFVKEEEHEKDVKHDDDEEELENVPSLLATVPHTSCSPPRATGGLE